MEDNTSVNSIVASAIIPAATVIQEISIFVLDPFFSLLHDKCGGSVDTAKTLTIACAWLVSHAFAILIIVFALGINKQQQLIASLGIIVQLSINSLSALKAVQGPLAVINRSYAVSSAADNILNPPARADQILNPPTGADQINPETPARAAAGADNILNPPAGAATSAA